MSRRSPRGGGGIGTPPRLRRHPPPGGLVSGGQGYPPGGGGALPRVERAAEAVVGCAVVAGECHRRRVEGEWTETGRRVEGEWITGCACAAERRYRCGWCGGLMRRGVRRVRGELTAAAFDRVECARKTMRVRKTTTLTRRVDGECRRQALQRAEDDDEDDDRFLSPTSWGHHAGSFLFSRFRFVRVPSAPGPGMAWDRRMNLGPIHKTRNRATGRITSGWKRPGASSGDEWRCSKPVHGRLDPLPPASVLHPRRRPHENRCFEFLLRIDDDPLGIKQLPDKFAEFVDGVEPAQLQLWEASCNFCGWPVEVLFDGQGKMYLHMGWDKFARDLALEPGCQLTFLYEEDGEMIVKLRLSELLRC
ncbi:hypothetical protein QYE76_023524 [Lolium multiflorum]|uniref:TF-B3 domain-containing protein n=1 Tax=Lolium multiflorum TaxID=4521 RepID=A0AAD8RBJ8_LOLMU|nr:hypothetical protein QYE76_023524 [Lolium multiflorum]